MDRLSTILLSVSLLVVLSASGCTTIPSGGSTGVEVLEFSAAFSEVSPGEPILFDMRFKNMGSEPAEEVFAELLGLDEDWFASSKDYQGNRDLHGEILPRQTQCQYDGDKMVLLPPSSFYGTDGAEGTCSWLYKAPASFPSGFSPTYKVTGRVFYNYKTHLVKSITVFPVNELLSFKESGRTIPTSTTSSSVSPITITAEAQNPIRVWNTEKATFPIKITVSNTGGGMACESSFACKKASPGGPKWNQVKLSIKPTRGLGVDCEEFGSSEESILEVWPNRDNSIVCEIEILGLSELTAHEERIISIQAEYGYFKDVLTEITII